MAPTLAGCSDVESITVVDNEVEQLDVRVAFRDGGICANQSIRQLVVTKNSIIVYDCVNTVLLSQPCVSNDKFEVVMAKCPQCAPNDLQCCKFNFFLNFKSLFQSDTGTYTATVTLTEDRGRRRDMTKTFYVDLKAYFTMTSKYIQWNPSIKTTIEE